MADTMTHNKRLAKVLWFAGPLLMLAWFAADQRWHHGGLRSGEMMVFALWVVSALLSGGRLTVSARDCRIAAGFLAVCLVGEAILMHFARQQPLGGWADMWAGWWPIIFGTGWLFFWLPRGSRMSSRGDNLLWTLVFMIMFFAQEVLSPQFWHGVPRPSGWVIVGWVAAFVAGVITGLGTRLEQPSSQRLIADGSETDNCKL